MARLGNGKRSLDIAVAPNGDLWLAGSTPDDVYRSTDDGAIWISAGILSSIRANLHSRQLRLRHTADLWLVGGTPKWYLPFHG